MEAKLREYRALKRRKEQLEAEGAEVNTDKGNEDGTNNNFEESPKDLETKKPAEDIENVTITKKTLNFFSRLGKPKSNNTFRKRFIINKQRERLHLNLPPRENLDEPQHIEIHEQAENTNIQRREYRTNNIFLLFFLSFLPMSLERREEEVVLIPEEEDNDHAEVESNASDTEDVDDEKQESWKYCLTKWSIYAIIWLTLFFVFLKLQFGAVYFVVSSLIIMYFNTRTRPKRTGEVSAYSVFNENCVRIDGTLDAEQFEREIRYGPGNIR